MNEYEKLIADFLAAMAGVEAPLGEYCDALSDAKYQIEAALDAGKEDLARTEAGSA